MTVLTHDEIRAYAEPILVGVETGYARRMHFVRTAECRVYVGQWADCASAAFDVAASLLEPEQKDFRGALVWMQKRYPSFENCEAAFRRIRLGWGVSSPVDQTPGHLFGPAEFTDAVTMLGFLMTFGWGVTWLPAHAEYLLAANEDRMIDFAVRGGHDRWYGDRKELFDNLEFEYWPQMTQRFCEP